MKIYTEKYKNFITAGFGTGYAKWGNEKYSLSLIRVYPNIKFWLINNSFIGLYINVGVPGPTILSKNHLNNRFLGSKFIFNDILGVGIRLGNKNPIEISFNFHHYSNGNLIRPNPGFDVPAIICITFSI